VLWLPIPWHCSSAPSLQRSQVPALTLLHQRAENDQWVNAYNTKLLKAWGANMDIQMVGSEYGAALYVCMYNYIQVRTRETQFGSTKVKPSRLHATCVCSSFEQLLTTSARACG
jgi:hypothetical protein